MFALTSFGSDRKGGKAARFAAGMAACLCTAAWLSGPTDALAGFRQTPPSTPGNFHVTATNTNSVSFAWTASKAGSDPSFVYVLVETSGLSFNVGNTTSYTDTVVAAGATYSFYIYAIDTRGNKSANSPTVTVTLPVPPPPPPILPAPPVVSDVSVTPDSITLSWTESTPDSELAGFGVLVDGESAFNYGVQADGTNFYTATEWTIFNLTPGTTYTLEVVVESKTGNQALSAPTNITTTVSTNNIAPTAPTDLAGWSDGGGEAIVSWNPSTSPYEPSSAIYYRIYVNGIHEVDADTIGQTTQVYVFPDGSGDPQPVYVVAVDQYGNVSPPSNILSIEF
jgi:hypothetical protein